MSNTPPRSCSTPIDGRVSMGVYTPRARRFRIISARKANAREVQAYERHTQDP